MADLIMQMWDRQSLRLLVNSATGQLRIGADDANGSVGVDIGTTGLRDVTGSAAAGALTAGRLLLVRNGNHCVLDFVNLTPAEGGTNITILPAVGASDPRYFFRPPYLAAKAHVLNAAGDVCRVTVSTGMALQIQFAQAGIAMTGHIEWDTEMAWPASLPGVADGQPVGF